jgi:hypothetical protein
MDNSLMWGTCRIIVLQEEAEELGEPPLHATLSTDDLI